MTRSHPLKSVRTGLLIAAVLASACLAGGAAMADEATERGPSGLPLPRFVSLSANEVNVRMGPSRNHKIKWTFRKSGLPVEIVSEFGNWRRVRDSDGEEGWIHASLLSGRRTALVNPWTDAQTIPLRASAAAAAPPTAYLEPFVLAHIERCDGSWCAVEGSGWRGLVPQNALWGVYPSERVQ